jgi:AhpD family alkylhydroperoxidase
MSQKYNTHKHHAAMLILMDSQPHHTQRPKNKQGDKNIMQERINYYETNRRAVDGFAGLGKHLTTIDEKLRALIELRISQINGCVYCLDLHARQAREAGEFQQRLDCLAGWQEFDAFDGRERVALAWAESLTHISETHAPDALYEQLGLYFTEQEIVDLTIIVAFMNAWNRISISFRGQPDPTPVLAEV